MNKRTPHGSRHQSGPSTRRATYEWIAERERRARRQRIAATIAACIFILAMAFAIAFSFLNAPH